MPDQRIRRSWWIFAGTFLLAHGPRSSARLLIDGAAVARLGRRRRSRSSSAIAALRHRQAVADLETGRRAEAESFARILSACRGRSRADAIVGAIVEELGDSDRRRPHRRRPPPTGGAGARRPRSSAPGRASRRRRPSWPPEPGRAVRPADPPTREPPPAIGVRDGRELHGERRRAGHRRPDRRAGPERVRPDPHAGRPAALGRRRGRRDRPVAAARPSRGPRRPDGCSTAPPLEASAALSRAYSHRAAEAQASTDALTGLPNRRYFDEFCGAAGAAPAGRRTRSAS